MSVYRVVENRVDALTLAFRVELSARGIGRLRERGAVARKHGRASFFDLAGAPWSLCLPMRGDGQLFRLTSEGFARVNVDAGAARVVCVVERPKAEGADLVARALASMPVTTSAAGWSVEIIFAAQYLADHRLADVIEEARAIARSWGEVLEERTRRIDLAADVAGFDLRINDWQSLCRRSRAQVAPFSARPRGDDGFRDAPEARALADATVTGSRISGIRVGRGDVVARCYDKPEELRVTNCPEKFAAERARWTRRGWDGAEPVTRVEFQLRGAVLRELGARTPVCADPTTGEVLPLPDYVPRLWATCLKWLRLTVPGTTRTGAELAPSRRELDPRWAALSSASWGSDTAPTPIDRVRVRGAATAAQALGALVSCAGAVGLLADVPDLPEAPDCYEHGAMDRLNILLAIVCAWGRDAMAAALVERWGNPADAAAHVAVVVNAARERFARCDARAGARAGPEERNGERWKPKTLSVTTDPAT